MYYSDDDNDDDNDDCRSEVFAVKYLPRTQDDPHYAPLPTDRSL